MRDPGPVIQPSPVDLSGTKVTVFEPQLLWRKELLAALRNVPRLGPKRIETLISAGFETIEDLAYYYPGRYLDGRELVPLADLKKYLLKPVSVRANVISAQMLPGKRRSRAVIVLQDESHGVLQ